MSAIYKLYTAKGVCTQAETPGGLELLTTQISQSTQALPNSPNLITTIPGVTRAETPNMVSSEFEDISAQTEIVNACIGTSKLLGALGAIIAFLWFCLLYFVWY